MIVSELSVKIWIESLDGCPSVDTIRPVNCPHCVQSSVTGLRFHGHGTVWRLFRMFVDGALVVQEVLVRRYKCCSCGHSVTVGPREMRSRYRYSLALIGFLVERAENQR